MSTSSITLSPLASVQDVDLRELCNALWDWKYCDQCNNDTPCETATCPWQRANTLQPFFNYYKHTAQWSIPEVPGSGNYALRNHRDLFDLIQLIRIKPEVPRSLLTEQYFTSSRYPHEPSGVEQQKALEVAIKVMNMIDCSMDGQSSNDAESGLGPVIWYEDKTHYEFMNATFPINDPPRLHEGISEKKRQLTATKLKKIARIKLEGTPDLKNHLRFNPRTGIVQIFHHMTFLREHLLATRDVISASDRIPRDFIPRQLALETHDSLRILFPLAHDSEKILQTLASRDGFDFDYPDYDKLDFRRENEREISYQYWGTRLLTLYDELQNPTPRGISQWVQARATDRHFMTIAILGSIFAVLTLAIGIFQSWVSYQQWKHPVNTASVSANA